MKTQLTLSLAALVVLAAAVPAPAQSTIADPAARNRLSLGYRFGFNVSAKFENLGGMPLQNNLGAPVAGIDHFYDDGFNRVDGTGNAPLPGTTETVTTWWGYQNASQVTAGNQAVVMSGTQSAGTLATDEISDDPHHGLELTYQRILGQSGTASWGFEAAFGYTSLEIQNGSTLRGSATRISDAYNLGGVIPPVAPYAGLPTGPGVLLGDTPTRTVTTIPGGATVTGSRNFSADLYGVRIGPFVQLPLSRRFFATVSGGLALVSVHSDFQFSETVTVAGTGSSSRSGSGSDSDLKVGGYVGGNVNYLINPSTSLFLGYQYQNVGNYMQTVAGKKATLDLGESIFVTLGVGYSF